MRGIPVGAKVAVTDCGPASAVMPFHDSPTESVGNNSAGTNAFARPPFAK